MPHCWNVNCEVDSTGGFVAAELYWKYGLLLNDGVVNELKKNWNLSTKSIASSRGLEVSNYSKTLKKLIKYS